MFSTLHASLQKKKNYSVPKVKNLSMSHYTPKPTEQDQTERFYPQINQKKNKLMLKTPIKSTNKKKQSYSFKNIKQINSHLFSTQTKNNQLNQFRSRSKQEKTCLNNSILYSKSNKMINNKKELIKQKQKITLKKQIKLTLTDKKKQKSIQKQSFLIKKQKQKTNIGIICQSKLIKLNETKEKKMQYKKQKLQKLENIYEQQMNEIKNYKFVKYFMKEGQVRQKLSQYILNNQHPCRWPILIVDQVFTRMRKRWTK